MKIGFKNNRQNIIASDIIEQLEDILWKDAPENYDQVNERCVLDENENIIIQSLEEFSTYEAERQLVIQDVFSTKKEEDKILQMDIALVGLHVDPWNFTRGYKTTREYKIGDTNGPVACYVEYTYVFVDGERSIKDINRYVHWLDKKGDIALTKKIHSPVDRKTIKSINRDIRQGRLDYLEAGAELLNHEANNYAQMVIGLESLENPDTAQIAYLNSVISAYRDISSSIEDIFSHYDSQIAAYISRGSSDFEEAVLNETNQDILEKLQKTVRLPDELFPIGLNAGQSIIYQLNGTVPQE